MREGPAWLGIGAQRSGTTWFTDLMLQHPEVRLSAQPKKELHRLYQTLNRPKATPKYIRKYLKLFNVEGYPGEFTPFYLRALWVPEIARQVVGPDTPIIVLLRDPVERFESAMRMAEQERPKVRRRKAKGGAGAGPGKARAGKGGKGAKAGKGKGKGGKGKGRRAEVALAAGRGTGPGKGKAKGQRARARRLVERPTNRLVRWHATDATWAGMYATQLDCWAAAGFNREQFIVMQYEVLKKDPQAAVNMVWERMGLTPVTLQEPEKDSRTRTQGLVEWTWPAGTKEALQRAYEPEVERLVANWGIDRSLWRNF
jgi:hypothetical protein